MSSTATVMDILRPVLKPILSKTALQMFSVFGVALGLVWLTEHWHYVTYYVAPYLYAFVWLLHNLMTLGNQFWGSIAVSALAMFVLIVSVRIAGTLRNKKGAATEKTELISFISTIISFIVWIYTAIAALYLNSQLASDPYRLIALWLLLLPVAMTLLDAIKSGSKR